VEERRLAHRLPGRHARPQGPREIGVHLQGPALLRPRAAPHRLQLAAVNALHRLAAPYLDRRMVTLLALGFASGLPVPLVFANLSIWLHDEGVTRTSIGLFALASAPYAINFLWAPLVDRM